MKQLLITIAAVVLVGCGESQSPEPPTAKAPDRSIHNAAYDRKIELIKQHLAAGTDVNAKNEQGRTPLHVAAWDSQASVLLIEKGADVNAKDDDGNTPLHEAASDGNKEIVELLIAKGADVNAMDDTRRSPLDSAQKLEFWHKDEINITKKEIAELLRKHGGKTGEELKAEGK